MPYCRAPFWHGPLGQNCHSSSFKLLCRSAPLQQHLRKNGSFKPASLAAASSCTFGVARVSLSVRSAASPLRSAGVLGGIKSGARSCAAHLHLHHRQLLFTNTAPNALILRNPTRTRRRCRRRPRVCAQLHHQTPLNAPPLRASPTCTISLHSLRSLRRVACCRSVDNCFSGPKWCGPRPKSRSSFGRARPVIRRAGVLPGDNGFNASTFPRER